MSAGSELRIVLVYPELLGTYGDRGNAVALAWRSRARGLETEIVEVAVGDPLPTGGDIYLIGGSEDAAQVLALHSLLREKGAGDTLAGASACLAVCAGFQILARDFTRVDGNRERGLGLLDVSCGRLPGKRAVGEVLTEPEALEGLPTLTGYENHQGDAALGPAARPLGRVLRGVGNGSTGLEGAVQGSVVGTYLHGPVLVRNPALTDHLLEQATGPLAAFDDEAVEQLRAERLAAAAVRSAGRWRGTGNRLTQRLRRAR